jgi:hypothetical protein
MPHVQFARNNHRTDLLSVLALWHELTAEWHPASEDPLRVNMRQRATQDSLSIYLQSDRWPHIEDKIAERACGFEIVLRLASGYPDTFHSTKAFFAREENRRWFTSLPGRKAGGNGPNQHSEVALTSASLEVWESSVSARRSALVKARKLLESDTESQGIVVALLPAVRTPSAPSAAQAAGSDGQSGIALGAISGRSEHLAEFVRRLHTMPFQPAYRKKPVGMPVLGWDQRLTAYFWPTPQQGYRETCVDMNGIGETSRELAEVLLERGHWDEAGQRRAVELANAIFSWGGVPQAPETVTSQNIEHVFRAAIANDAAASAKMNSGWTKVSAFATAHFETSAGGKPQAIWDSRVATAITSRLDAQLPAGVNPAELFPGVGTVPGRGGTRPRALSRSWKSGYQTWAGQVGGSQFVREIRDMLNEPAQDYPPMPLPGGETGPWTTRGVEMVLFMDGY